MVQELKLKGNELIVYAIIYGFSQDGQSEYHGSQRYIAKSLSISLPTVNKVVNSLLTKNLIVRTSESHYKTVKESLTPEVLKKVKHSVKETLTPSVKETLTNNNNTNNNYNNKKILGLFGEEEVKETVVLPDWLDLKAWNEWLEYRKERKLPTYKPLGLKKLLKQIEGFKDQLQEAVDKSIANNWQGLFPPKGNFTKPTNALKTGEQDDIIKALEKKSQR